MVLFYAECLAALQRAAKLDRLIGDCIRGNPSVTASGLFSADYLQRCLAIVGPEPILFSTDSP